MFKQFSNRIKMWQGNFKQYIYRYLNVNLMDLEHMTTSVQIVTNNFELFTHFLVIVFNQLNIGSGNILTWCQQQWCYIGIFTQQQCYNFYRISNIVVSTVLLMWQFYYHCCITNVMIIICGTFLLVVMTYSLNYFINAIVIVQPYQK